MKRSILLFGMILLLCTGCTGKEETQSAAAPEISEGSVLSADSIDTQQDLNEASIHCLIGDTLYTSRLIEDEGKKLRLSREKEGESAEAIRDFSYENQGLTFFTLTRKAACITCIWRLTGKTSTPFWKNGMRQGTGSIMSRWLRQRR